MLYCHLDLKWPSKTHASGRLLDYRGVGRRWGLVWKVQSQEVWPERAYASYLLSLFLARMVWDCPVPDLPPHCLCDGVSRISSETTKNYDLQETSPPFNYQRWVSCPSNENVTKRGVKSFADIKGVKGHAGVKAYGFSQDADECEFWREWFI